MAYNKTQLTEKIIEVIKEHKFRNQAELFVNEDYAPCSEKTFYNHKLQDLQEIKKAFEDSKTKRKLIMLNNWEQSKSPALQIAAFKILATPEEFERLVSQKLDHTSKGDSIKPIQILTDNSGTSDELKKLIGDKDNSDTAKK